MTSRLAASILGGSEVHRSLEGFPEAVNRHRPLLRRLAVSMAVMVLPVVALGVTAGKAVGSGLGAVKIYPGLSTPAPTSNGQKG
jgi:hypothetical protein